MALVRLTSGDGIEGLGEVAMERPTDDISVRADAVVDAVEGVDVADDEDMRGLTARIRPFGPAVASAVGSAAWDLRARASHHPLSDALGSRLSASVALNALVGAGSEIESVDAARAAVSRGFGCIKLKRGNESLAGLVRRVASVRSAIPEAVRLRLDANGSLDDLDAARLLELLAPYGIDYVEDPLPSVADHERLVRLRRESPVRLALDEAVTSPAAAERLLADGAADALIVKPARVGGVGEASAIARQAAGAGVEVVLSTLYETGIGLAGALHLALTVPPAAHGLATASVLETDLLRRSLPIAHGRMSPLPGPGLGVELDEALVATLVR